jgi:hypothetical protein
MSQHDTPSTGQTMPSVDSEYDNILSAVMETARGRWFLHEYVRRNRNTDTGSLLAAINRIEALLKSKSDEQYGQLEMPQAAALAATVERFIASVRASSDQVREIADSLLESGAPRFLCNDLNRQVGELMRACAGFEDTVSQIRSLAEEIIAGHMDGAAAGEQEPQTITLTAADYGPWADVMALSQEERIALFT